MIKLIKAVWNFFRWLDEHCIKAMLHNKTGKF